MSCESKSIAHVSIQSSATSPGMLNGEIMPQGGLREEQKRMIHLPTSFPLPISISQISPDSRLTLLCFWLLHLDKVIGLSQGKITHCLVWQFIQVLGKDTKTGVELASLSGGTLQTGVECLSSKVSSLKVLEVMQRESKKVHKMCPGISTNQDFF